MKRSVLLYWLLLFLPTLVITAAAFRLLRYEQERLERSFQAAHADRANTVAQGLKQTVLAVEEGLLQSLKNLTPITVESNLPEWVHQNPLVRNVFIWSKEDGLQYPPADQTATREERHFVMRYNSLFDDGHPWYQTGMDHPKPNTNPPNQKNAPAARPSHKKQLPRVTTASQDLLELARARPNPKHAEANQSVAELFGSTDGGWLPWFTDNRLYLIGWAKPSDRDLVWGVEMELATLLSRLIIDLPIVSGDRAAYALQDSTGRILHQWGDAGLDELTGAKLTASLGPVLPHWQVAVFFSDGLIGPVTGQGYMILSGLLVMAVIAAILFGGILLYRDAARNRREAERKTTFVANVSHELKTPLTSIRMYAELIRDGRVKSPEKQKSYIQVIVDESRRLGRLVNNLLDFSRIERGRKTYRLASLDLSSFLLEFDHVHRIRIENEGIDFTIKKSPEAVHVITDRDVIEQVLLNLVDNVIKYAISGKELTISLNHNTLGVEIHVLDRGPGISAKNRRRVFEKYYRADNSLTAEQPGSGLGLSIARHLMRDLGGDLVNEEREDGGACFKMIIAKDGKTSND